MQEEPQNSHVPEMVLVTVLVIFLFLMALFPHHLPYIGAGAGILIVTLGIYAEWKGKPK